MNIDHLLFKIINEDLSNPVFDLFFPVWTDIQKHPIFFFVLLPILIFLILRKRNWRLLRIVLLCGVACWATDNINHFLLKPMVNRERPKATILRLPQQKSSSFPSSHAADAACIGALLSLFYPKRKRIFLFLAALTAFSRVYLGVHFPSDVLAGIILGTLVAFLFYKMTQIRSFKPLFFLLLFFPFLSEAVEWKDPTEEKSFFPWAWEDQLKPTIKSSVDSTGLVILGAGAATTLAVRPFDESVFDYNRDHPILFGPDEAVNMGRIGNGVLGVGIAVTQLVFDQENGLKHSRALLLATASHFSLAAIFQRARPGDKTDFLPYPSSFPSGHTTAAFATAGSLAYAYGPKGGIPAYLVAGAVSLSRIRDERHWASDIVAGAFLGTFWARASYSATKQDDEAFIYVPTPFFDGLMLTAVKEF